MIWKLDLESDMAIVCTSEYGWVLDHAKYSSICYENTKEKCFRAKVTHRNYLNLCLKPDLFKLHHPFMTELQFEKYKEKCSTPDSGSSGMDQDITSKVWLPGITGQVFDTRLNMKAAWSQRIKIYPCY